MDDPRIVMDVVEVGPATLELSGRLRDWAGDQVPS